MAEAIVSAAVETLGNLLIQEARFLRGVSGKVKGLQTELRGINSLLKDADKKQHKNDTIRNWIKEIRCLAYQAEDVLEEYVVKAGSGNGEGFLSILKRFICFANEICTLHNLGSAIETIKSEITILTGKMKDLGIITSDREETNADENKRDFIRKAFPQEELQHFVGMDYDVRRLVSLLVSEQETCHRYIGVWGMGGSGKTTVANMVYKHVHVRRCFQSFAWVCITQKCDIQSVMQNIFRQLLPEKRLDIKDMNEDELVEQINKARKEKKCLIVVDDIWNRDDWECLSKCLSDVGSHSKVLLTTRNGKVAEIGYSIQLKGFTEDEAWEFLHRKAFAKIDLKEPYDDDFEHEKLGRKMIRKCDRLPLAVAVLGGILSGKNTLEEWKIASHDVISYIGRSEGTGEPGKVEKVLALSYDELPYHLKLCFLSLGFLREDQSADVERIYDLWMAEGFIQSKHIRGSETMRDVAKYYLYELQFRSMVQLRNQSTVLSLHDSILDLCQSKAKEEEFLKVVDKDNISERAYRLLVHVDPKDDDLVVLKAVENDNPLRFVQIFNRSFDLINLPKEIFNHPQFKSLRILIVYSCDLRGKCFHGIENLIHLRFLGLRYCQWERFSLESVDKLSFLQTLDLSFTKLSSMNLVPMDIFYKIRQLRHLCLPRFVDGVRIEGKLRLMNLSQLETLNGFEGKFYELKDLIHLKKLQTLRGCRVNDDESLVQITDYICQSDLRWIEITIENCDLNRQQESDALRKLLRISNITLQLGIESCRSLKLPPLETVDFSNMYPGLMEFNLYSTSVEEDIMQALGKFPNLKKLDLQNIEFGGEEMICDAGSFPQLEELIFSNVLGGFKLRIDEAAMPNLSSMKIASVSITNFLIPERLRFFADIVEYGSLPYYNYMPYNHTSFLFDDTNPNACVIC